MYDDGFGYNESYKVCELTGEAAWDFMLNNTEVEVYDFLVEKDPKIDDIVLKFGEVQIDPKEEADSDVCLGVTEDNRRCVVDKESYEKAIYDYLFELGWDEDAVFESGDGDVSEDVTNITQGEENEYKKH